MELIEKYNDKKCRFCNASHWNSTKNFGKKSILRYVQKEKAIRKPLLGNKNTTNHQAGTKPMVSKKTKNSIFRKQRLAVTKQK